MCEECKKQIAALIAENERLTKAVGLQVIRRFVGDDDQKNIDELVAAGIQVDKELIVQLKAENERLAAACERAEQIIIVECKAASLEKVRANLLEANRDQLRAELAGLKTGYEAYEQVNAELKAENERLERNRDMWKGQVERQIEMLRLAHEADKLLKAECEGLPKHAPSSEIIWCECGDGYPANSCGAGFMDANEGVCANCDAALGQGEQP
ncbi:hypothetical protein [Pseudomonas extremaustralis]|uniref:hypothetical protein n=1 Tax=Pseudomonas extremaustralis TaxID=359110 RepID=UPI002307C3EF|nr:hypothetical protein [Pseudomonas extremaustralis]MDB1108095.1 hypothetical protein [Pseudomonas extremaustralis]